MIRTDKQYYIKAARKAARVQGFREALFFVLKAIVIVGILYGLSESSHNESNSGSTVWIEQQPDGHYTYNGKNHWSPWPWMN